MNPPESTIFSSAGMVEVAGGALYYTEAGQGPAIVFAHGLGGGYLSWFQQVPAFARRYRCIAFNHRGFLPSTDATGAPRPKYYADDLRILLDRLGVERAVIVAQSMGGWTATEFALASPERVEALILCGTTGSLRHEGLVSLLETSRDPRLAALRAAGIHPAAGERMAREQPELHRRFVEIGAHTGDWDRAPVRAALDRMRRQPPEAFARLGCPILALVGEEDVVCPPGNAAIMAEALPAVELSIVRQAGHSVYFERADLFNAMVLDFLAGRGAPT